MIAAPMPNRRLAGARAPIGVPALLLVVAVVLAACGGTPSASPRSSGGPSASGGTPASPAATPSPSPTPEPTPYYTNPPDADLAALIPATVGGQTVTIPSPADFSYTPGDIGEAYGDIGLRFRALQVAYVPRPHALSLFAMRVEGDPVTTEELEPYLAGAGQYVGIHALDRKPWELKQIAGRLAWVRPEDNATAAGTMIYTWATDGYVFLMIGTDDALNQAMFAALPAQPAPTPTPRPSRSPAASGSAAGSAAPSAEATASGG